MKLIVKNMVCPRCISSVEQILKNNSLKYSRLSLGEIELKSTPTQKQLDRLSDDLQKSGFELLDDQKKQVIEKIKSLIIQKVQSGEIEEHFVISKYLANHVMVCADCHSMRDFTKYSAPVASSMYAGGGKEFTQEFGWPGDFLSKQPNTI